MANMAMSSDATPSTSNRNNSRTVFDAHLADTDYLRDLNERMRPAPQSGQRVNCDICGGSYRAGYRSQHLFSTRHKRVVTRRDLSSGNSLLRGTVIRSSTDETMYDIVFTPPEEHEFSRPPQTSMEEETDTSLEGDFLSIEEFFAFFQMGIASRIEEATTRLTNIKINTSLSLTIQKLQPDGTIQFNESSLRTRSEPFLRGDDIEGWFVQLVSILLIKYEDMPERGSNWTLSRVNDFELHINQYTPLIASSYIPLPTSVSRKKAVINVRNTDERCFAYAVMSQVLHSNRVQNPQRPSNYTLEIWEQFNFENIRFPTPFADIKIFERDNQASVNVYGLENDSQKEYVYPIRISDNFTANRHFNLLYLQEDSNDNEVRGHYCFITDLARLVVKQLTSNGHQIFICQRCLVHFTRQDLLDSHVSLCGSYDPIRSRMPHLNKLTCEFKNHHFKEKIPYIIYADFESALLPFSSAERDPNLTQSYTDKKQLHIPTSYCYYIVSSNEADNTDYQPRLYRGPNAVRHFWDSLREDIQKIDDIYNIIVPMNREEEIEFRRANINDVFCHICGHRPSINILDGMVVDHCHLTGRIRGWACNSCNLNYKLPAFVPIVFHNGSHYDYKFIISEIYNEPNDDDVNITDRRRRRHGENHRNVRARNDFILDEAEAGDDDDDEDTVGGGEESVRPNPANVKIIAQNCENFISFEVPMTNNLSARFIDSCRFLQSSLATLANNLTEAQMNHTRTLFPGELLPLARRKGVFPYEHIKDPNVYNITTLPAIEDFYSALNDEGVSDEDYQHARCVWDAFNCSTIGDYSDVYLKIDVILLADVFENFRCLCLENYQLDPAWVYSAPGLAWNAMLKVTGVKLELFSDPTMYLFCEAGSRGGYCCASHRYSKANLPDLPDFDPNSEPNTNFYVDANNLYGHSMSSYMPIDGFRWMEPEEIENLDVLAIPIEGEDGYILEVDLEYPPEIHEEHNDLPYCPQQLKTSADKNDPRKLIGSLHDKKNYIIHYRYLQSAIQNGLRLRRIHRGLKFRQARWLECYIRLNNEKRTAATDEFSKCLYKLLNNSIFGKFLESVRKHRAFILTQSLRQIRKLIRKPNFKNRIILNEQTNLTLLEMRKTTIVFDKFIQGGSTILDLSKAHMYGFHYNIMKGEIFPDGGIKLMYKDTDSLTYSINTSSLTERLLPYKTYFDFSNYPTDHPLYDISNKGVLGKMKDEAKGGTIMEYCALKAKMYSFYTVENVICKKAKGVKKNVVSKTLTFEDYVNCLRTGEGLYRSMRSLRSYNHRIHTICQKKIALTSYDDKRCVLEDGIHTLAWGHRDIPHEEDLIYLLNDMAIDEGDVGDMDG